MSYPRGCVLHTGRVYGACEAWAKVTHSQGWSKDWPFPPTVAATVGEKTSQGQVVRCWGGREEEEAG